MDLTSLQQSGDLGSVRIIGIIKEVGPVNSKGELDDALGVADFQNEYFNFPVYLDRNMSFCKALGERKIYSVVSWNPIKLYQSISRLTARTEARGITGNLAGEGIVLGGVLLVKNGRDVVYQYEEQTGSPFPVESIARAVLAHSDDATAENEEGGL